MEIKKGIKTMVGNEIESLASDFKEIVTGIESNKFPTTKNNYGRYLSIISHVANGEKQVGHIIGLALIEAGANKSGVQSALKIAFN